MDLFSRLKPTAIPLQVKVNGKQMPALSSSIEYISPEIARAYLANANQKNRPVSPNAALKYARDMKEGRWSLTGEPILFDSSGMLLDGHHRLTAAAVHDCSFETVVIRGVSPDAVNRIDGGRTRTAADMAHMDGMENAATQCAILRLLLPYLRHGSKSIGNPKLEPTKAEIVDALRGITGIDEAGRRGNQTTGLMAPSVGGFCYYLFAKQDHEIANRLWDELRVGAMTQENPAFLFLRRMNDNARSKSKLKKTEIMALAFKTWIAYRANKKLGTLRWANTGPTPESFPEI